MRSCSVNKAIKCLCALCLALCLSVPFSALAKEPGGINTEEALRILIEKAADGATLYVDDITFSQGSASPIVIDKSLTLCALNDRNSAVFSHGAFLVDGRAADISVSFENITFYEENELSGIKEEDWSGDNALLQPAIRFQGNAEVMLSGCIFRGYMSLSGADLYADYSDSSSRLSVNAENCSFLSSAACLSGGAAAFIGQKGSDNVSFTAEGCTFSGNLSGNRQDAFGGGAIYAENALITLTGCSLTGNEASHQYLAEEKKETEEKADDSASETETETETETEAGSEAEQKSEAADTTKGGAVYAKNSRLTMSGCTLALNRASLGGALAAENTELMFRDGVIARNRAESARIREGKEGLQAETGMGGAVYVKADRDTDIQILNSSLYGNTALNAYALLYLEGMGTGDLPYQVGLAFCTIADNTADTSYSKPEVPREDYFPEEETEDGEEAETEAAEGADKKDDKAADEADKKAKEEALKAAEKAYEEAVLKAAKAAAWHTVPGDIWSLKELRTQACLVIDDSFSSLKRNNAIAYPRHELPSESNGSVYYAAPEAAIADDFMPEIPSADYPHIRATAAFRAAYPAPEGLAEEVFSPYCDKVIGEFDLGDNTGTGKVTYQLLFEGNVWKEIEVEGFVSPDLSAIEAETDGYHFVAWQDPDGTPYQSGVSCALSFKREPFQVNAIMEPNTYTISLDFGSNVEEIKQVYGEALGLPDATGKRGYKFVSWYTEDGTAVKDGEPYLLARDAVFTAEYAKRFPLLAVILLSATIVGISLYLIITRAAGSSRRKKALSEIAEAEEKARLEAEEKKKLEAEEKKKQAEKISSSPMKKPVKPRVLSASGDGLHVPLEGTEELYAEEAAVQEAEAALEAAAEAEKTGKTPGDSAED